MAVHAVRIIDETRRRGSQVAEVSQDAFNRWNTPMERRGKTTGLSSPNATRRSPTS
jgi:hypothetical protein